MKNTMHFFIITAAAMLFVAATALQSGATVRIGTDSRNTNSLKVDFQAIKPVVKVGERIRFKVTGSQKFYLYLFSVSDSGEGVMLLPNVKQQYHLYKPGKEYIVPEKNVEFFSDRPGVEAITMVATTKKLDLDSNRYKTMGQFYAASKDIVEDDVKSLRIRSRKEKARHAVKTVKIVVAGQANTVPPAPIPVPIADNEQVIPFVSCDKKTYADGDTMNITFGADKAGYVYLWYVSEKGNPEFLLKKKVDGERFGRVDGVAEAPFGKHTLVAVWDEKGTLNKDKVQLKGIDAASFDKATKDTTEVKGISLKQRPSNYAVYEIMISR